MEKPAQYLARKCPTPEHPIAKPSRAYNRVCRAGSQGPVPLSSQAGFQWILICPKGEGTEEGTASPNHHESAGWWPHSFTFTFLMAHNKCTSQPHRCDSQDRRATLSVTEPQIKNIWCPSITAPGTVCSPPRKTLCSLCSGRAVAGWKGRGAMSREAWVLARLCLEPAG